MTDVPEEPVQVNAVARCDDVQYTNVVEPTDDPRAAVEPVGRRLAPEERRQHLLDVATSIVEQDGSLALTMETVAERANVSRGLVYAYFGNRTGLVHALWDAMEQVWGVEPMPAPEVIAAASSPRAVFDARMVENTKWYFDKIEQVGLLYHRLMAEPQLEPSIELMRKRIHRDNVQWWARLVELMGVGRDQALVFSTMLNSASEGMWELVATGRVNRDVLEDVFFRSSQLALDGLLESGRHPLDS